MRSGVLWAALAACLLSTPALADPLPVSPAEKVGLSSERLQRLTAALKAEVDKGQMPGAVVAIARKGQLAYFETVGYVDPAAKAPMPRDAIFSIASMTKPMVSVAIMMLHDEGKLLLSDPIGKYLPQARQHAGGRHQDRRRRQVDRRDGAGQAAADHPGPAAAHGGLPLRRPQRHRGAQAVACRIRRLGHDLHRTRVPGDAGQPAASQ